MFSNRSTENLLDNLEKELSEVIELDNPVKVDITTEVVIENEVQPQPIAAKRNFDENVENLRPIAAARKQVVGPLRDKKDKNDENEIIQLSSISSSSHSEDHKNSSYKTILRKNSGKKEAETVFIVDEKEKSSEKSSITSAAVNKKHEIETKVEIVTTKNLPKSSTSVSSSEELSSEASTTSSSSEKVKRKKKKKKTKTVEDEKSQISKKRGDENSTAQQQQHDIGISVHSCGPMKFDTNFKTGLKIKITLYNGDTGKMIGDAKVTSGLGKFNNEFHNLMCFWNEIITIEEDLEKLKSTHNSILIFFEICNAFGLNLFWAFLKFFTPDYTNIDDKFQLQLFHHQKIPRKSSARNFFSFGGRKDLNDLNVFDQWQSMERQKVVNGILTVTVKNLNKKTSNEKSKLHQTSSNADVVKKEVCESLSRKWKKLPGQACKVPNKLFKKIIFREKGSMNVKFNHEGNLIAFTEVTTRDGSILHVYKFPEMQQIFTMLEHSDLIHDIDWWRQKFGCWMLTASSDFTAIIWRLEESSYTYKILPHPSFVYAAKFLQEDTPSNVMRVVTAGRDNVVRIWQNKKNGNENFELIQELDHPEPSNFAFITSIATKNSEAFYTANSLGEIIEWKGSKDYQINRRFKLDEIEGNFITSLEMHPRGNKLFVRVQDSKRLENCEKIFVIGIPTAAITQKLQQPCYHAKDGAHGRVKVSPCGSHLFSSNGQDIRYYSITSGNLSSLGSHSNFLNFFRMPTLCKISSMDYHRLDFYFAMSIYGHNGGIVIMNFEMDEASGSQGDFFEKLKADSSTTQNYLITSKQLPTSFTEIIRRLDEVFFAPADDDDTREDDSQRGTFVVRHDNNNTFTVNERRSQTYSVSQGPATFTIQPNNNQAFQNNTYEIQKNEKSDDDTTISESLN